MIKLKAGLFGGTFNPVHCGHLKAAEIARENFSLDKVLFIPSYIPPHKKSSDIASPSHRLRMVELACKPYSQFSTSSIEIDEKGTSYSVNTLRKIREQYPETMVFFILGIDAFLEIETWKEYDKLIDQCFFIVVSRPGYHLDDARKVLGEKYREKILDFPKSGEKEEMYSAFRIFLLPIEALNITSSRIRSMIKQGIPVKGLVPEEVELYIKKHRIYQKGND